MKRTALWFLMNGLFAAGVYFAYFENVVGAERLVVFYAWVSLLTSFAYLSDDLIAKLKEKGRAVPQWLDVTYDLIIISAFVWFGAWATGAAYFVHFIFHTAGWAKATAET